MSIYISASSIKDYLTCRKKLYYRLRHPELSIDTPEMIIGKAIHEALEKVPLTDLEDAKNDALFYMDMEGVLDNKTRDFVDMCFENFDKRFSGVISNKDIIEKRFKIEYYTGIYIVGKMDRIAQEIIYDWKTERRPPTRIDTDPQFILYNWAYNKIYGKAPISVIYASLVDAGGAVQLNYNQSTENVLLTEIIPDMIECIKSNEFSHDGYFNKKCYRCQYKETCLRNKLNVLESKNFT